VNNAKLLERLNAKPRKAIKVAGLKRIAAHLHKLAKQPSAVDAAKLLDRAMADAKRKEVRISKALWKVMRAVHELDVVLGRPGVPSFTVVEGDSFRWPESKPASPVARAPKPAPLRKSSNTRSSKRACRKSRGKGTSP
jgi:hypothetical protein